MAEEKKRPEAALHDSLPVIRNDAVVKQKEGATAPQKGDGYIALRELLAKSFTPEEIAEVDGAYALARQSHEGQHRYSGEPYIIHPICVARILAEMGMDKESVIAALLHDVVEDTDETLADITAKFGKTIAHLVDGVTKLGKVPLSTKEEQQAENIRKMLLAMSQDIRVIIIKLADRLHNMRTLNFKPEQKRRDTALERLKSMPPSRIGSAFAPSRRSWRISPSAISTRLPTMRSKNPSSFRATRGGNSWRRSKRASRPAWIRWCPARALTGASRVCMASTARCICKTTILMKSMISMPCASSSIL